jgi:hypothetical protein
MATINSCTDQHVTAYTGTIARTVTAAPTADPEPATFAGAAPAPVTPPAPNESSKDDDSTGVP